MKIVSYFFYETFLGSVEFIIYKPFSHSTGPWMVLYILYLNTRKIKDNREKLEREVKLPSQVNVWKISEKEEKKKQERKDTYMYVACVSSIRQDRRKEKKRNIQQR